MPYRLAGANPASVPAYISTAFNHNDMRYGADVQFAGYNNGLTVHLSVVKEMGKMTSNESLSLSMKLKF